MKVRNAIVGMEVQVKRDCYGHSDELIKGGLVCIVDSIMGVDYELRLLHPDIEDGYAWVNALDVRKYVKPPKSPFDVEPDGDIRVGDSVLVGAEGAGYMRVLEEYSGLVCDVVAPTDIADCVRISHPDVRGGSSYTSRTKYLTKVSPKPELISLSSARVGDYIVANDTDPHLQEGVAYRVVKEDALFPMVSLHHSENADWRKAYCVILSNVAKILREVNDATPRMAKSGSESTCRSE